MQEHLDEFEQAGVRVVAISVDPPAESRKLSEKAGYTFPILSDENTEVIRRYQLLHKGARGEGHDVARPAEFFIDRNGVVQWRNLTEDLRVRARPEDVLEEVMKRL